MNTFIFILLLLLLLLLLAIGITLIIIKNKYTNPTILLITGIILITLAIIGMVIIFSMYLRKPKKIIRRTVTYVKPVDVELIPKIDYLNDDSLLQPEKITAITL
jgi:hypothetical protein